MAGETYSRRWPTWHDEPTEDTAADSQFFQKVEDALVRLLGEDPAADELGIWTPASGRFVFQKLTNAQVDPAAAIARSKLDFGSGLANTDIAAAAAILRSKLDFGSGLVNADIAAAAAIAQSKIAPVNYATTLPGSPTDAQETILVDSTTAPTYAWRLRYNSTLAKWQCIGGVPKIVTVATPEAGTATAYGNLATNGPDFTTPVAGDWQITVQARITAESGSNIAIMSYDVGATGALDIDAAQGNIATPERPTLSGISEKAGVAASTLIRARYKNLNATSLTYADRRLIIIPKTVS